MFHRTIIMCIVFTCSFGCAPEASQDDSVFAKKIEIAVGNGEEQIKLVPFADCDWPVTTGGFLVGDGGQLLFDEPLSIGFIKVFDSTGKFFRKFPDHGTYPIFLYDSILYGTRRSGDGSGEELVAFKSSDGTLLFTEKLPLKLSPWSAHEMEDGKIFFISLMDTRQVLYFDIQKRVFGSFENSKQYEDEGLNEVCSTYEAMDYEKIARISDYVIFRKASCYRKPSCLYQLIAGRREKGMMISLGFVFGENDIGYSMPDIPWVLIQKRYLYTIGYSRSGSEPGDRIIITCIDLQRVFPEIFR